jgi:SAM-dependent methyltransferase
VDSSFSRSAAGLGEHELADYYDSRYAGEYMAEQPRLEVERVEQVLAAVRRPLERVLDFGCGRGGWIPVLERAFPGAELTGIDISATAIERAEASFPTHRFMSFDGRHAPLPDASADLVFSYHVLEHVLDLEGTVAEIARLLPEGGQACMILPCGNPGSLEERVVRMGADGVDPDSGRFFYEDPGHLRRLTSDRLSALFRDEGLVFVRGWYANQLWGAIDFLARVGHGVIGELFRADRGRTRPDRARLLALRLAMSALTPFMQAYSLSRPWQRLRAANGGPEGLHAAAMVAAKLVSLPVGATVEGLARREWERDRERPNGSAQYLLFEKR